MHSRTIHVDLEQEHLYRLVAALGAPMQAKPIEGQTPEEVALAFSYPEIAAMLQAEAGRRAQCVAFAMVQHERLGAGSWVQELDAGVVRMVLERV